MGSDYVTEYLLTSEIEILFIEALVLGFISKEYSRMLKKYPIARYIKNRPNIQYLTFDNYGGISRDATYV